MLTFASSNLPWLYVFTQTHIYLSLSLFLYMESQYTWFACINNLFYLLNNFFFSFFFCCVIWKFLFLSKHCEHKWYALRTYNVHSAASINISNVSPGNIFYYISEIRKQNLYIFAVVKRWPVSQRFNTFKITSILKYMYFRVKES